MPSTFRPRNTNLAPRFGSARPTSDHRHAAAVKSARLRPDLHEPITFVESVGSSTPPATFMNVTDSPLIPSSVRAVSAPIVSGSAFSEDRPVAFPRRYRRFPCRPPGKSTVRTGPLIFGSPPNYFSQLTALGQGQLTELKPNGTRGAGHLAWHDGRNSLGRPGPASGSLGMSPVRDGRSSETESVFESRRLSNRSPVAPRVCFRTNPHGWPDRLTLSCTPDPASPSLDLGRRSPFRLNQCNHRRPSSTWSSELTGDQSRNVQLVDPESSVKSPERLSPVRTPANG